MRKRIFLKAIKTYHKAILKNLLLRKADKDDANEAVNSMVKNCLVSKSYLKIPHETIDNRMKGYLMQATQWELQSVLRKKNSEGQYVYHIVDGPENEEDDSQYVLTLKDELHFEFLLECPFCHTGVLNQHGACADCHTILGVEHGPRKTYTLEKITESECPDLGMFADVNVAMSKLTELEQKVVKHITQGNSTLEDLVEFTRIPRTTLWRIWVEAKAKLQQELFEYSHVNAEAV